MAVQRARLHLPFDQFPKADQHLWYAAVDSDDPFSDAAGTNLAVTTKNQYLFAWRRFLGFLSLEDPAALELPARDRLTRSRIASFARHLGKSHIPRSVAIQVDALYKAARVMMPDVDLSWLKAIKARLHAAAPLQRASGPAVTSTQILAVGHELLDEIDVENLDHLTLSRALRFRDGLLISLLAFAPLRRKNVAALTLSRHLVGVGDNRFICIPADETKTRTAIEFAIPIFLLPYLDLYLRVVRPRILKGRTCDALWVSPKGGPLRDGAIASIVSRHTEALMGIRLTPHDMRDAAATTWALAAPDRIGISRDLLSHSDLRTTAKHYNRAKGVEASRVYARLISLTRRTRHQPRLTVRKH